MLNLSWECGFFPPSPPPTSPLEIQFSFILGGSFGDTEDCYLFSKWIASLSTAFYVMHSFSFIFNHSCQSWNKHFFISMKIMYYTFSHLLYRMFNFADSSVLLYRKLYGLHHLTCTYPTRFNLWQNLMPV